MQTIIHKRIKREFGKLNNQISIRKIPQNIEKKTKKIYLLFIKKERTP
jgi:hypothetical protein